MVTISIALITATPPVLMAILGFRKMAKANESQHATNRDASFESRDASLAIATHVMALDEKIDKVASQGSEIIEWQRGHQKIHERMREDNRFKRLTQEVNDGR